MVQIVGHIADSAGQPAIGRIEFTQAQRIDTGEMLITQAQVTAQVVLGELRAEDGSAFQLPPSPEGSAVRIREMLGGRTFEWWGAVPDTDTVEYRAIPVVQSAATSVFAAPPWLLRVEQLRAEASEDITRVEELSTELGGLEGVRQAVAQSETAAANASASSEDAAAAAARAAASADTIDVSVLNQRIDSKADLTGGVVPDGQLGATQSPTPNTIPKRADAGQLPGIGAPKLATDAATKQYVDTALAGSSGTSPAAQGVPTDGTTRADVAFQAMLDALPSGAVVQAQVGQKFAFTAPVRIKKPVTIRGGEYLVNRTGATFLIESNDITLDGIRLIGPGASLGYLGEQYFVMAMGSASAPIRRTRILNCSMSGCQSSFLWLEWLADFRIDNNILEDGQYAGIMMVSPKRGIIRGNTVQTLRQGGILVNSYGIAVTDVLNTEAARAENVVIDSNFVSDVPGWKGIDTHGGRGIQAVNNHIKGCRTGISFTTGNESRVMPPEDGFISGNIIELGGISNQNAAIVLNGKAAGAGLPERQATGVIGHNVIIGYDVDLDLQYYVRGKVNVAPQTHNGTTRRSPAQQAYREYGAITTVKKANAVAGAVQRVTFPAGYFTGVPIVMVTKNSGAGAFCIPYVENVSAEGVDVAVYDTRGTSSGAADVSVQVLAIQTGGFGNGAAWV